MPNSRTIPVTLVLGLTAAFPAFAQGVADPESVDAIVGSEVKEAEQTADADRDRILAAIDKTAENTAVVRKTSSLAEVEIVFLPDAARTEGGPPPEIDAKVKAHADEITELRKEIEGNAMLYHAIDSRQILPADVLALEFRGSDAVVIFAAAKPAQ